MILTRISFLVVKHSHRPLFIPLPDAERVLEDGVHDSADAKGRLDYIGNNLLHCGKIETLVFPHEQTHCCALQLWRQVLASPLTVHSFLEPLHTDHGFGQFKCPALCLDAELPTDIKHHQINSEYKYAQTHSRINSIDFSSDQITPFLWEASPDQWCNIRHRQPGTPEPAWRLSCRPFRWRPCWAQTGQRLPLCGKKLRSKTEESSLQAKETDQG